MVGAPISGTRAYVLDEALRLVPHGTDGELYLAGPHLARGYHRRPALTATRFVADPFHPGERMYRTGDRARRAADGTLIFLGRTDDQVKIHGHRIELGEVENVLRTLPDVAEAVAVVRDQSLVAYAVPVAQARARAGAAGDADRDAAHRDPQAWASSVRERLGELLPAAAVPSVVVPLDALPTTRHGKIDRAALPAPTRATGAGRAPATPTETVLAEVVADIGQTAEGVTSCESILALAREVEVDVPIVESVVAMVVDGQRPELIVDALMTRERKPETA